MRIEVLKEEARGCGYRHSGPDGVGLYLMGDGIWEACERLPFPLGVCPCCGEGTKFSRGFTWITPEKLFGLLRDPACIKDYNVNHQHKMCLFCSPPDGQHGLMWVGEKFYSPGEFAREAMIRGTSKRIPSLPHGFEIGKTIVYLAHKKAGERLTGIVLEKFPGAFMAFKPSWLEIVVDTTNPDELPKRAVSIAKRLGGKARIVKIEPVYEQLNLIK